MHFSLPEKIIGFNTFNNADVETITRTYFTYIALKLM